MRRKISCDSLRAFSCDTFLAAVPVMVSDISLAGEMKAYGQRVGMVLRPSCIDCWVSFFRGKDPFLLTGEKEPFNIPILWSIFLILFFLRTAAETEREVKGYGQQMMLRYGTRTGWWNRMYLRTVGTAAAWLLGAFLACLLSGVIAGGKFFPENISAFRDFQGIRMGTMTEEGFLADIFFLPLLVLCTWGALQLLFSVLFGTVTGILVSVTLLVASAFFMQPFLPGNYLMFIRLFDFRGPDGISVLWGITYLLFSGCAAYLAGRCAVRKRDFS